MLQRSNTGSINVLDENAAFRTVSPSPRGPDQIHGLNAAHVQGGDGIAMRETPQRLYLMKGPFRAEDHVRRAMAFK